MRHSLYLDGVIKCKVRRCQLLGLDIGGKTDLRAQLRRYVERKGIDPDEAEVQPLRALDELHSDNGHDADSDEDAERRRRAGRQRGGSFWHPVKWHSREIPSSTRLWGQFSGEITVHHV